MSKQLERYHRMARAEQVALVAKVYEICQDYEFDEAVEIIVEKYHLREK